MLEHLPAYGIPDYVVTITNEDGVLTAHTKYDEHLIVDNLNLYGDTLGRRRLSVTGKLLRLTSQFYTLKDMLNSKYGKFINNRGKVFTYTKTRTVNINYYCITKAVPTEGIGFSLYCKEFNYPIISPQYKYEKYMGLMDLYNGKVLYELTDEKKKDTWRKI